MLFFTIPLMLRLSVLSQSLLGLTRLCPPPEILLGFALDSFTLDTGVFIRLVFSVQR